MEDENYKIVIESGATVKIYNDENQMYTKRLDRHHIYIGLIREVIDNKIYKIPDIEDVLLHNIPNKEICILVNYEILEGGSMINDLNVIICDSSSIYDYTIFYRNRNLNIILDEK